MDLYQTSAISREICSDCSAVIYSGQPYYAIYFKKTTCLSLCPECTENLRWVLNYYHDPNSVEE